MGELLDQTKVRPKPSRTSVKLFSCVSRVARAATELQWTWRALSNNFRHPQRFSLGLASLGVSALLNLYVMVLISPTCYYLNCSFGFTSTVSRPGLSWPLCRDCDFSKPLPCFSVSLESWCNLLWPCNAHTLSACDTIWITLINSAARERHSRELSRHFWGGICAPKWLNLENHYLVCLKAKQANKQKASQGFLLSLSHFNWIFIFTDWRLWWGILPFHLLSHCWLQI